MNAPNVFTLVVAAMAVSGGLASAQNSPVPRKDVVILALEDANHSADGSMRRLSQKLFGGSRSLTTLTDIQMEIVRKTASFGPVLLLAPDEETRSNVLAECDSYDLCDLIGRGRIRIAVVPHDTVWIRDYGPVIEAPATRDAPLSVVDAVYHDLRHDINRNLLLELITRRRRLLVEDTLSGDSILSSVGTASDDAQATRDALLLLREYADVIQAEGTYGERAQDDRASFSIAQTVLKESVRNRPGFAVRSTQIYLDGGNLLKLDDVCLTTRDLFVRNSGKEAELVAELKRAYSCADVLFLEALPGPVIEHVDMFLLPVGGKRVLLADYGLEQPHVRAAWRNLSPLERELTFQAAVAMNRNAAMLRSRGYDVVSVPALLPEAEDEDRVYYPTLLNALVRSDGANRLQVLLPVYEGNAPDVQEEAMRIVQGAFGNRAEIQTIEATIAARAQGAVHCLTITVPFEQSVFDDGGDISYRQIWALRASLNDSLVRVNRPSLIGRWTAAQAGSGDRPDVEVIFDQDTVTVTVGGRSRTATYVVTKQPDFKWPLELTFDRDQQKTRGRIDWLTDRSMRLRLDDAESVSLTRTFALNDLDTAGRVVSVGGEQDGILGEDNERDAAGSLVQAWELQGRAGERVTLDVTSEAFDPELFVIGPGFEEPLSDDDSGGDLNPQLIVEFPQTARYRVVVRSIEPDESGAFTIGATRGDTTLAGLVAQLSRQARNVAVGAETSGRLVSELRLDRLGVVQAWTLRDCNGRRLAIDLISDDFDPLLIVDGPGLDEPLVNDDSGTGLDSHVELACERGAPYTIVVATATGSESGAYTLRVAVLND